MTACNARVPGRSGAVHEIDVLAEKDDGLTTFRVAVECKQWARPVEKEAVAKLAFVLEDTGLNKGIIVCPSGARSGALLAALRLGVDVWDGDELARRLGPDATSNPSGALTSSAQALVGEVEPGRAETLIRRQLRGVIRRESLAWSGPVLLPAYELQLAVTRADDDRRPRPVTRRSWNVYEALGGALLEVLSSPAPTEPVELGEEVVDPLLHHQSVVRELLRTVNRYLHVTTPSASDRHAHRLASLGVETPVDSVEVEDVRPVLLRAHLGLVRRGGGERLAAVVQGGRTSPALDAALTSSIRHVLAGAGAPDQLVTPWTDVG